LIDQILVKDVQAPRKQRHTAHRIYRRLGAEFPEHPVAESTVRRYVRERKRELGLIGRDVCVPQSYDWGVEAQVDWYEAEVERHGEREKLQFFAMRSMAGGAASTGHIRERHNKPSWMHINLPFTISVGSFVDCDMTICRAP
jgi:hypothetical protein